MTITYTEMKKRIFSLDVLSTSYDERNRPIGARKLPTPITVVAKRIRNEYEPELKICKDLQEKNLEEYAKKDKDGNYISEIDEKTKQEVHVFKSKKAKESFFEKEKEILETQVGVKNHQVSMEDVLRIPFLEEWVLEAIDWLIAEPQPQQN